MDLNTVVYLYSFPTTEQKKKETATQYRHTWTGDGPQVYTGLISATEIALQVKAIPTEPDTWVHSLIHPV